VQEALVPALRAISRVENVDYDDDAMWCTTVRILATVDGKYVRVIATVLNAFEEPAARRMDVERRAEREAGAAP
jgi:hypothetical protein